jgi:hypothetical protein
MSCFNTTGIAGFSKETSGLIFLWGTKIQIWHETDRLALYESILSG